MMFTNYTVPEGTSTLNEQKSYVPCNRSLVCGVGINDHPTPVSVNGKHIKAYSLWKDMLRRCYSVNCQKKNQSYLGCSVATEWHLFSNFERWFANNYIEGFSLDKDILFPGNKVYGPDTCVFVSYAINNLLSDHSSTRGDCPLGVVFYKVNQNYGARIGVGTGTIQHLGCFKTPFAAHRAYQLGKAKRIETAETNNPKVRAALDLRVAQLRDDHKNGRITIKL